MDVTVSASTPHASESLPRAFGRYTLLSHLARGGMGDVFLAVTGDLRGFETSFDRVLSPSPAVLQVNPNAKWRV